MAIGGALAGCRGIPVQGEKRARNNVSAVGDKLDVTAVAPRLPVLSTNSSVGDLLQYAMLRQPAVRAAYFDWAAAVQSIAVSRSLPDPRLTFESDIADIVMTVMPGLMQEFPGPGKLRLAGAVATAESEARYRAFETTVLQAAANLKRVCYQLHFLEAKIAVNQSTLQILRELEANARARNETGKVTLQDVLRAQIEKARVTTEIANLNDSRNALMAEFKGALGIDPHEPDPPPPARFEPTELDVDANALLRIALNRNPRLRELEAEVKTADAALQLAYKARVPDFSAGVMTDVKASPVMVRPQVAMTLPIWRDKISAEIARAQYLKQAAASRHSAGQIAVAVEWADRTFTFREISRNLSLLNEELLPKAKQSLDVARAGYLAGQIDFLSLIDAERTLLAFQLENVDAETRRELILTEISLLILGQMPAGAPVLDSVPASSTKP
jgi:cobalt-zinc-cadmium efflux system outer membrane protein